MEISEKVFGSQDTQAITLYTLKNDQGFQMSCINYGCAITEIIAPDRNGNLENVVLGFDTVEEYKNNPNFFGAMVGVLPDGLKTENLRLMGGIPSAPE
ncbi:hypothetical protein [Planococcus koreensis]|uniref:aldose epimerase family protein n=1 Tax=Planococcus koreensis TaxID=112331 RepID=UPI0039FDB851